MNRRFLLIIIIMFNCSCLFAQQIKLYPFKINGNINADTGTVVLRASAAADFYYPKGGIDLKSKVSNGKFFFEGYLPYPLSVFLEFERFYYSDAMIIAPGTQSITININANNEIPKVDNPIMTKDYVEYRAAGKEIREIGDSLSRKSKMLRAKYKNEVPKDLEISLEKEYNAYYRASDKSLLNYVSSHPDSYTAFWTLIRLTGFGYENIFDTIFPKFSDTLRHSYAGKVLEGKLKTGGKLAIGKLFPLISCVDVKGLQMDNSVFLKNKYTLVDFWYSNCGPCRAQFPGLKEVYHTYKSKGFEIVGISTDQSMYKQNWIDLIEKDKLSWLQYLDLNGVETANLSIIAFPTNFLLNSEGKIIEKNIRPTQLNQFLNDHIK